MALPQERDGQTLTLVEILASGPIFYLLTVSWSGGSGGPLVGLCCRGENVWPLESGCPRIQIPAVIRGQTPS